MTKIADLEIITLEYSINPDLAYGTARPQLQALELDREAHDRRRHHGVWRGIGPDRAGSANIFPA